MVGVRAGTLKLGGGGSGGGSFNMDASSRLLFDGDHSLSGSVNGQGTVNFTGNGVRNLSGSYNVTGVTEVTGGTVNFVPGMTQASLGALNIRAGRINFSHGLPIVAQGPVLLSSSGELTGSAPFTASQLFTWTGGSISGSGTVTVNGGVALSFSTNYAYLQGRTLINTGSAIWNGGPYFLFIGQNGVFNNPGTFDTSLDSFISSTTGGGRFNNPAAFRKSLGRGTF